MSARTATEIATAILITILAALAAAQDTHDIQKKLDAVKSRVGDKSVESFKEILLYPTQVIDAALEISQYPELIVRVYDLGYQPGAALHSLTARYPEEIQKAARVLIEYREVLEILESNIVLTGMIGELYHTDEAGMQALARQKSAAELKEEKAAVLADLNERLNADQKARAELVVALQTISDTAEKADPKGLGKRSDADRTEERRFTIDADGTVHFFDAPRADAIDWLLDNAEKFPALFVEVYYHVHHYRDFYKPLWHAGWEALRKKGHDVRHEWKNWPGDPHTYHRTINMQAYMRQRGYRPMSTEQAAATMPPSQRQPVEQPAPRQPAPTAATTDPAEPQPAAPARQPQPAAQPVYQEQPVYPSQPQPRVVYVPQPNVARHRYAPGTSTVRPYAQPDSRYGDPIAGEYDTQHYDNFTPHNPNADVDYSRFTPFRPEGTGGPGYVVPWYQEPGAVSPDGQRLGHQGRRRTRRGHRGIEHDR